MATGKSLLWPLVDVINQTRRLVSDGVVPADPEREELCAAIEGHTEVLAAATAAANEALAMSHAVALEESEALSAPADGTHEIGCGVFGCNRLRFVCFFFVFLFSFGFVTLSLVTFENNGHAVFCLQIPTTTRNRFAPWRRAWSVAGRRRPTPTLPPPD